MKLFQRLLVAPAALGLMAPIAATAAELNINDVSNYSTSGAETQSISDFSDVHPSDWAYQALNNLRVRHGCTAASPNSSMTRYEAAALLNKCLNEVAQVNEEEQSLIDEFGAELAVIRGRLGGLENDLDGIEAGVFSSTTKLSGSTTFVIGGVDTNTGNSADNASLQKAVTFNYDTKIALESSFSGEDLFVNRIRVGNFGAGDPFGPNGAATLETASDTSNLAADDRNDVLVIDRSYYQFPLGDDWSATIGAKVRQDDMLGVWPSAYPSDAVLDILTYAGSPDTYNLQVGGGAGVTWSNDNLVASAMFVSVDADDASSEESTNGGMLTKHGDDSLTGQIAWVDDNFTIAAAYTHRDNGNSLEAAEANDYGAYALSGVYQFDNDSEWVPSSISAGYGWKNVDNKNEGTNVEDGETWTVGLLWNDAFVDGNNLGFGIGTAETHRDDDNYDDPLAWELFYQMAVSDNITVTPAVFVINRDNERNDDVAGALVKTTFSF